MVFKVPAQSSPDYRVRNGMLSPVKGNLHRDVQIDQANVIALHSEPRYTPGLTVVV